MEVLLSIFFAFLIGAIISYLVIYCIEAGDIQLKLTFDEFLESYKKYPGYYDITHKYYVIFIDRDDNFTFIKFNIFQTLQYRFWRGKTRKRNKNKIINKNKEIYLSRLKDLDN